MTSYANYMIADTQPGTVERRSQPYANTNNFDFAGVTRYPQDDRVNREAGRRVREGVPLTYTFDAFKNTSDQLKHIHNKLRVATMNSPAANEDTWQPWMQSFGLSGGMPVTQSRIEVDRDEPYGDRLGDRTRQDDYIVGANSQHLYRSDRVEQEAVPERYRN